MTARSRCRPAGPRSQATAPRGDALSKRAHVPGSHSRPGRPGCRHGGRDAVGRGLSRRQARAGLSELRLRAHRRAGRLVLPYRRQGDPAARADPRARRPDRPGPDPVQGDRRLSRVSSRLAICWSTATAASPSCISPTSPPRLPRRPCAHRAGERARRSSMSGRPLAQRGAARRLRGAHRRRPSEIGRGRDRARRFPARSPPPTSPPPPRRTTRVAGPGAAA